MRIRACRDDLACESRLVLRGRSERSRIASDARVLDACDRLVGEVGSHRPTAPTPRARPGIGGERIARARAGRGVADSRRSIRRGVQAAPTRTGRDRADAWLVDDCRTPSFRAPRAWELGPASTLTRADETGQRTKAQLEEAASSPSTRARSGTRPRSTRPRTSRSSARSAHGPHPAFDSPRAGARGGRALGLYPETGEYSSGGPLAISTRRSPTPQPPI